MKPDAPIVSARPSASILLIRDGRAGLEVLMMQRPRHMRFAPGALVFPGGAVDVADMRISYWRTRIDSFRTGTDLPNRIAAARELFEETGILLADGPVPQRRINHRPLGQALDQAGLQLAVSEMVFFAHWITPEMLPLRFDTRFYLAPLHRNQRLVRNIAEADDLLWLSPAKVLADWDRDEAPLMFPTRLNLIKLARAGSVSEALAMARRTPVVCTLPVLKRTADGTVVRINPETGYGVVEATPRELRVESGTPAPKKA